MPRIHPKAGSRRQAAILFVSIVLLTLFLVIGLCFVLFAESQASSSRIYREANNNIYDAYPTAYQLLTYGMSQVIYDVDDVNGEYSALRGHSLARNMYGWNYTGFNPPQPATGTSANTTPFNGSGRLHTGSATYMSPYGNQYGIDDANLINYMFYASDLFKRDPERYSPYTGQLTSVPQGPMGPYTGGANAPYTAPDLNNVYLAAVDGSGNVNLPSFWRGDQVGFRAGGYVGPTLSPANPAWTDPTQPGYLKYMSLRPLPSQQLMTSEPQTQAYVQSLLAANQIFPAPASATGDVRNMPGPGPNDSVWVDLGWPEFRLAASGLKVKPMFAFLIVDLDGRVNINVAGNTSETLANGYHGSVH
jgi:hypothetical protein